MAMLEIGIRIDLEAGIAFFGVEEVNQKLASGARLVEVRPGGAVFNERKDEASKTVHRSLAGLQFEVVFEDA